MLPVWMLTTKYKDENYTFAMNGQTGKLVGRLPTDKGKAYFFLRFLFGLITSSGAGEFITGINLLELVFC